MTKRSPKQVYDRAVELGRVSLEDLPHLLDHSLMLRKQGIRKFVAEHIDADYARTAKFRRWVNALDLESVTQVDMIMREIGKGCRKPLRMLEIVMLVSCTTEKLFPNHAEHIRNGLRDLLHVILTRYWSDIEKRAGKRIKDRIDEK